MRPTKLTTRVLSIFQRVLTEDHNSLVCTDEELCILVNDRLNEHERISYRTFQRYKAKAMKLMSEAEETQEAEQQKDTEAKPDDNTWLYQKLYILWRKAIVKQKNQLMTQVLEAKQGWQRFKWLLEKKMEEWQPVERPLTLQEQYNLDPSKFKLGMTFS